MSGFEVIGVIASTSQLIHYTCEIINYTRKSISFIKGTSCQFEQHREHLENLISVVEVIRQTPSFQTRLVQDHLHTLVKRTESLQTALGHYTIDLPKKRFKRFLAALSADKAEAQILNGFTLLERDKTNLLICITSSNGIVLHGIRERTNSSFSASEDTSPDKYKELGALNIIHIASLEVISNQFLGSVAQSLKPEEQEVGQDSVGASKVGESYTETMTPPFEGGVKTTSIATLESTSQGDSYTRNGANNGGSIIVGPTGQDKPIPSSYEANHATGKGSVTLVGPATLAVVGKVVEQRNKVGK